MKYILALLLFFQGSRIGFPAELDKVIDFMSGDGLIGHGALISGGRVLTAEHLTAGGLGFVGHPKLKGSTQLSSKTIVKQKDISIGFLTIEEDTSQLILSFAKDKPMVGDLLYWVCLSPEVNGWPIDQKALQSKFVRIKVVGHVMATSKSVLYVNGFSAPGCSGSPILNSRGEIVAVHSGTIFFGERPASVLALQYLTGDLR